MTIHIAKGKKEVCDKIKLNNNANMCPRLQPIHAPAVWQTDPPAVTSLFTIFTRGYFLL